MSSAELAHRYAHRAERGVTLAESGARVIGIVGRDVPAHLVTAAGGEPYRIPPEAQDVAEAESYLGRATDRAALAVAAAALDGRLDHLRGILIAHDSEGSVRLFYALRELHRRGRILMPVHLVDQVHLPRESTLRFNTGRLADMMAAVSEWTGSTVDPVSLAAAWDEHRARRQALILLRDARPSPDGPTGTDALRAYGIASAAPDAGAVDVIADVARGRRDPRRAGALPVLLTGSAPLDDSLYRAVESAGAVIVGEDHDWGDPVLSDRFDEAPPTTVEEAAAAAARARLQGDPASASASMAARAAATAAAVRRTGARALLGVIRPHDDAPAWDWERQRAATGVPAVLVRGPEAEDPDAVRAALAAIGVAV